MNDYSVIEIGDKINEVAKVVAREYKLNLNKIEFVKGDKFYGKCSIDGTIKIKLQYSDNELVPLIEAWRTLAHELAHLRFFNHGADFWYFNREILNRVSELIGKKIRPEIAFTQKGVVY